MIVVDVGCHEHEPDAQLGGREVSIGPLYEWFRPEVIFGFDPHPGLKEGLEWIGGDPRYERRFRRQGLENRTLVVRSRQAAWVEEGFCDFIEDGLASAVVQAGHSAAAVPCFDFCAWLKTMPIDGAILKFDCEGAEYPLLWNLYDQALDLRVKLVLVEWHTGHDPAGDLYGHGWNERGGRPPLRCEVRDW